ncbi:MAG: iron-containing alcohol dehydrogenase [Armatimonadetes bacterium]|nr:iron-containing alcohol dehydrogenase [Armatimonadota bacterium]
MEENATRQWTMSLPTKVEFGTGCLDKLKDHLRGYRKALVITGRGAMKKAGVTDRVRALIEEAGVECRIFDDVSPDPDCTEVDRAAIIAREFGADVVIGCGGGSAMDAAKAVAVAATHPGPILDYRVNGPSAVTRATLPIIAISATSGTGSHVGRASVISDRSQSIKRAIICDYIYPRVAFCDPELPRTMPADVTAATGFDAFTHALEGYLALPGNPMGSLCALEAMRIIFDTLPDAVRNGDDLELRAKMSWADTLAGVTLATNGITTPHVLAMLLGGRYGVTHGCALASVTVAWLMHTRDGAADRLASIARAVGCADNISDETAADRLITKVESLIVSIGLDKGVCDHGVPWDDFTTIVADVQANFDARLKVDPVPPDADGLNKILNSSK